MVSYRERHKIREYVKIGESMPNRHKHDYLHDEWHWAPIKNNEKIRPFVAGLENLAH